MTSKRTRANYEQHKARKYWKPIVAAGRGWCWRCGLPIAPDEPFDMGHHNDVATSVELDSSMSPEHRSCNRSAGAQLGVDLRAGRSRRRRRLGEWIF